MKFCSNPECQGHDSADRMCCFDHGKNCESNLAQTSCDFDAIDWVMAVRKFGLDEANRMFP